MLSQDNKNNKIVFLTGTRADYGKIKSLIRIVNDNDLFEPHIFATGMHMLSQYGLTYNEIIKDGFPNIYPYVNQSYHTDMDIALSNTITGFSNYISAIQPLAIVVHGDRLEALAGAIVGAFHNIKVFHIEGGEVSGTIDESIRHAISKFSHFHLVANESAKKRILQLGEPEENIFILGSPDIDIMHSENLPTLSMVQTYYDIPFDTYNIVLYHPVTTAVHKLAAKAKGVVDALLVSEDNYVVIYPNNDTGNDIILNEYQRLENHPRFKIFPSMRFEYFLTLLKNASCIIGNSSSGIREACIYGIPAIDLGNRQEGRYRPDTSPHIIHADEQEDISSAIKCSKNLSLEPVSQFGNGDSDKLFMELLQNPAIWGTDVQKRFIDINF